MKVYIILGGGYVLTDSNPSSAHTENTLNGGVCV